METSYRAHFEWLHGRYQEILAVTSYSGVFISSGNLINRFLDDSHYTYFANPCFVHWLPLTKNPGCAIWIEAGKRPKLFYQRKMTFWTSVPPLPEGFWSSCWDIEIVADQTEMEKALRSDPAGQKCIEAALFIGEDAQAFGNWNFKAINDEQFLKRLHFLRTTKSAYEQACVDQAMQMAARAHKAVRQIFEESASCSEYQLHMAYLTALECKEDELPYGNILALNEHAAILHFTEFDHRPVSGLQLGSLLVDAGARFLGHAADITRTYAKRAGEYADLVARMDQLQLQLISELRIGERYSVFHRRTHELIAQLLRELGLVSRDLSPDAIFEKRISHLFFPHGLGHMLGIQVHDVGGNLRTETEEVAPAEDPYLRCSTHLENGHLFTVEPGLYFIDFALAEFRKGEASRWIDWAAVERLKPFGGVRIEDDILVRDGQFHNLTRKYL